MSFSLTGNPVRSRRVEKPDNHRAIERIGAAPTRLPEAIERIHRSTTLRRPQRKVSRHADARPKHGQRFATRVKKLQLAEQSVRKMGITKKTEGRPSARGIPQLILTRCV